MYKVFSSYQTYLFLLLVILLQNQTVKRSLLAVLPLETGALFFVYCRAILKPFALIMSNKYAKWTAMGKVHFSTI
ncbi:MAG: hypothetical protein AMJ61_08420 [Desulfobacterales bacterium SG8_35_2]|nr:MAG: hypothetical protein AMJ61_08420 [Desulfobacterales bacterium SG8_35_2]